ncbi:hypothetical protein MMC30_001819 [Trapelia coarctata]|nr:hypothetical protein [Trapelia coarctata]
MAETVTVTGKRLSEVPPVSHDGIHGLFANGDYSDFTVKCGKRTWPVHRAIICSRSAYFKTVCDGSFKVKIQFTFDIPHLSDLGVAEILSKEAQQASITLEDDDYDSDLIHEMLLYLYTMRYPQTGTPPREPHDAIFDAKMYAIADKYDLQGLKQRTRQAFSATWGGKWNFALFTELMKAVYELTPDGDRGLRDQAIEAVWTNRHIWLRMKPMQELIAECQGLKEDILQQLYLELSC